MNAADYQRHGPGDSFVCASGLHPRCVGTMVDELWKKRTCNCECHEVDQPLTGGTCPEHGTHIDVCCESWYPYGQTDGNEFTGPVTS